MSTMILPVGCIYSLCQRSGRIWGALGCIAWGSMLCRCTCVVLPPYVMLAWAVLVLLVTPVWLFMASPLQAAG